MCLYRRWGNIEQQHLAQQLHSRRIWRLAHMCSIRSLYVHVPLSFWSCIPPYALLPLKVVVVMGMPSSHATTWMIYAC